MKMYIYVPLLLIQLKIVLIIDWQVQVNEQVASTIFSDQMGVAISIQPISIFRKYN